MERRAIEFHDSELLFVRREGPNLRVRVSAYVHVSDGEPGRDSGTGWTQDVDFILRDALVEIAAPAGKLELADGRLRIDDRLLENLVPLPVDRRIHTRTAPSLKLARRSPGGLSKVGWNEKSDTPR